MFYEIAETPRVRVRRTRTIELQKQREKQLWRGKEREGIRYRDLGDGRAMLREGELGGHAFFAREPQG